jgi:hypothetical protein
LDRRDAIFKVVVVMEKDAGDYEAELKAFMLYRGIEGQWRGSHPNFKDEARWRCRNKQLRQESKSRRNKFEKKAGADDGGAAIQFSSFTTLLSNPAKSSIIST